MPPQFASVRRLERAQDAVALLGDGADVIVSMLNGEPMALLDALLDGAGTGALADLAIHQAFPLRALASMTGALPGVRHYSYFVAAPDRPYVGAGVEVVPTCLSEAPALLRARCRRPVVLATVAEHDGRLYWGTNAEYVATLVRDGAPALLEINRRMPYLPGSPVPAGARVLGALPVERPLISPPVPPLAAADERIADYVAERIPERAVLQIGVGAVPDRVCARLRERRDLHIHSELFSDGLADLMAAGATRASAADPAVATFALGSERLYAFMDGNPEVQLRPVDEVNEPARIARHERMVSVCATTEVDLTGQCASETVAGRWFSGTGGQLDFMRGARLSPGGRSFMVLRSTLKDGSSRIKSALAPGSAVTTGMHFVDMVVTEHGVAELKFRSLPERARALIAIAAPEHRERLAAEARGAGVL